LQKGGGEGFPGNTFQAAKLMRQNKYGGIAKNLIKESFILRNPSTPLNAYHRKDSHILFDIFTQEWSVV
jgi:hypothetical protein